MRKAFTLIELLVVIAIISVLISILLPALQGAREEGSKADCLAKLKEHGHVSNMYMEDEGKNILPFHMGFEIGYNNTTIGVDLISEHIYGGYQTLSRSTLWQNYYPADFTDYPTDIRPFNKYVAPGPQVGGVVVRRRRRWV
jgi:prepilin-type N-terminal cleavage/methylation domain-containing protein